MMVLDARARLQEAAMALFAERGFDRVTAAQIAARAGVTERTFFRHFADKREVLFDGQEVLRAALTAAITAVPHGPGPLDVLFQAFRDTVPLLEGNRAFAAPRQALIATTPALHERELAKHEALAAALAAMLHDRGVAPLPARLAAQTGMAAYVEATAGWLALPDPGLAERIDAAHRALVGLFAPAS